MWLHPECALPSGQSGIGAAVYPTVQFQSLWSPLRIRSLHVQPRGKPRPVQCFLTWFPDILPLHDYLGTCHFPKFPFSVLSSESWGLTPRLCCVLPTTAPPPGTKQWAEKMRKTQWGLIPLSNHGGRLPSLSIAGAVGPCHHHCHHHYHHHGIARGLGHKRTKKQQLQKSPTGHFPYSERQDSPFPFPDPGGEVFWPCLTQCPLLHSGGPQV